MGTRIIRTDDLTGNSCDDMKVYVVTMLEKGKPAKERITAEVELSDASANALFGWMTPTETGEFDAAQLVAVLPRFSGNRSHAGYSDGEAKLAREWAKSSAQFSGRKIPERGRIPADMLAAYREAQRAAQGTVNTAANAAGGNA